MWFLQHVRCDTRCRRALHVAAYVLRLSYHAWYGFDGGCAVTDGVWVGRLPQHAVPTADSSQNQVV